MDRSIARDRALQNVIDLRAQYTPLEDEYLQQISAGKLKEGKENLLERTRPAQLAYVKALQQLTDYETAQNKEYANTLDGAYQHSLVVLLIVCALSVGVATALAIWMTRTITRPLAAAVRHRAAA